uniref:DDE Tnp4 domain-containing protein n=1 Tax=Panagrellus redivivus TaxID=6233 RepID=A0A7E4ZXH0_PANRE
MDVAVGEKLGESCLAAFVVGGMDRIVVTGSDANPNFAEKRIHSIPFHEPGPAHNRNTIIGHDASKVNRRMSSKVARGRGIAIAGQTQESPINWGSFSSRSVFNVIRWDCDAITHSLKDIQTCNLVGWVGYRWIVDRKG